MWGSQKQGPKGIGLPKLFFALLFQKKDKYAEKERWLHRAEPYDGLIPVLKWASVKGERFSLWIQCKVLHTWGVGIIGRGLENASAA